MSAGELEHEWAGTPGRLIRERYRRAAEHAKNRGKMPCLIINDLDAGIGIQANVQRTVRCCVHARLCVHADGCPCHQSLVPAGVHPQQGPAHGATRP
jgi:hypothetical protein